MIEEINHRRDEFKLEIVGIDYIYWNKENGEGSKRKKDKEGYEVGLWVDIVKMLMIEIVCVVIGMWI
ncbi:hypothetical protein [Staphylococcus epidermidis]|uniref:hypothetical protein n=1 Tax=Staphylococcus epidermidis TaxID=1282 RepID=UPI0011A57B2B|nr:hypothetical protein [Staphylococcus epidermidis]